MSERAAGVALAALMMAALGGPATAQDNAARSFTMQGSWTLDAGEDYCRLAASFEHAGDTISFALERNRAENQARLVLVGNAIRTFRGAETITFRMLPNGSPRTAPYIRSQTADGQGYYNLGNVIFAELPAAGGTGAPPGPPPGPGGFTIPPYDREAELAFARQITGFAFEAGLQTPLRIETGNMAAPMQALQACTDDLLQYWGLDYQRHQTMTRRAMPAGPAFEWLPANTIGFQDFANLTAGRNPVRVMVSAEGRPTACHVHWPSLPERRNQQICNALMANARFEPALDAEGRPMASYWMAEPFMLMRPMGGPRR